MNMGSNHWFKNAIIYHILIDRFSGFTNTENCDKPIFLGGNIKGITEKISYLLDLGVNTIWISPFYRTSAYHGYHVTDFFQVDPHFGTLDDIKELIKKAHTNDMHIIADFVPNHCSKEHPYFKDAQSDKNSKYRDWFFFTNWPNEYMCFLSIKDIPKLNLENLQVKDHIIGAAKYWLGLGFDGFRLDHVIGPILSFWKQFTKEIKTNYPNSILIGEAWMMGIKKHELNTININNKFLKWLFCDAASDKVLKEYIDVLDGVLDFKFQEIIRNYIAYSRISKNEFDKNIKKHYKHFPENYFLPAFLDNHDTNRFLFQCKNDKDKLKAAAQIQFSVDQPPIIYYGTETGIVQEKSIWDIKSHGDLQARQPMNWDKQDVDLFSFYKKLILERKITFGNFRTKTNSF